MPPERVRGGARRRLADKLVALGLAEAVGGDEAAWWTDPERGPIGLRLAAHACEDADGTTATESGDVDGVVADAEDGRLAAAASAPRPAEPRSWTKIARVLALLRRPEGADLATLVAATGWLPHTARAALTGLRHKGHAIAAHTQGGRTVYRLGPAAGSAPAFEPEAAPSSSPAASR